MSSESLQPQQQLYLAIRHNLINRSTNEEDGMNYTVIKTQT
ncbi:MAG TPA: hypothetical protein VEG44_03680 [Candidatus Acidoferrales bacterium]|nr:hypothetical protein [Candidatus Acidoferrales bacterium]